MEAKARTGKQGAPTVTYHDACYLGRHNRIYSPPRELLEATGAKAVEMPRSRETAFCCGGGGAKAFMEESIGTRIAVERSREADVRVTDIASLMLEAVHRGRD